MNYIEEKVLVIDVHGEFIFLEREYKSSCDKCSSRNGCENLISVFTPKSSARFKINNTLGLKKGDNVIISMPSVNMLTATVVIYLFPLLLLFIFSFLAKMFVGEVSSIVCGLLGFFWGLILIRHFTQKSEITKKFQPKLIRKIIYIDAV